MRTTKRNSLLSIAIISVLLLNGCAAGPTSRYVDGRWEVSENICSSNPDNPDLGDMKSELRQYESFQNSFERKITMYHLERKILDVSQKFTRAGQSGSMDIYNNSAANDISETIRIRHTRELNNLIEESMVRFFENDPDIDGSEASSFCLFRGQ